MNILIITTNIIGIINYHLNLPFIRLTLDCNHSIESDEHCQFTKHNFIHRVYLYMYSTVYEHFWQKSYHKQTIINRFTSKSIQNKRGEKNVIHQSNWQQADLSIKLSLNFSAIRVQSWASSWSNKPRYNYLHFHRLRTANEIQWKKKQRGKLLQIYNPIVLFSVYFLFVFFLLRWTRDISPIRRGLFFIIQWEWKHRLRAWIWNHITAYFYALPILSDSMLTRSLLLLLFM